MDKSADPARPFDLSILERARRAVADYQIVLSFEDGEWYGRGVELPGAMNDGKTADECVANTREMFVTVAAAMLESGEVPPPPASEGARTAQVNIRLTAEEKLALEAAASREGFSGVSEFVRVKVLAGARD